MTPDRIDDLLARALADGAIPADATAEERAALAPLLAAAGELRLNATRVSAEAEASVPAARARFQRHLAAQRAAPAGAVRPAKRGWLSGLFGGRGFVLSTSVAAMAVLAVLAVLIVRPFSSVETASALTVDDFVQVQGVVAATQDGRVTVQSAELGKLEVALSELTSVMDGSGARAAASLRPGDPVLVSGVATARKSIAASAVAVGENQGAPTPAVAPKVPLLRKFRQIQGVITVLALSPDGANARVLIRTADEQVLVDIERQSLDNLLANEPSPVGLYIRLVDAPELPKGVFRLAPADSRQPPREATPGPRFQNVRGVIVSRNLNVIVVRTDRGLVPVVIVRETSLRLGQGTLTVDDLRSGETAVGHEVVVSGGLEPGDNRRVIANVIVVLPKRGQ